MLAKLAVNCNMTLRTHKIHQRNNPISACALHILNNKHECGNADQIVQLLIPCKKGNKMNCWESFYIHIFQQQNTLIDEQKVSELNPLHTLANITRQHVM
jgi:trans-aconitate methyltransferase